MSKLQFLLIVLGVIWAPAMLYFSLLCGIKLAKSSYYAYPRSWGLSWVLIGFVRGILLGLIIGLVGAHELYWAWICRGAKWFRVKLSASTEDSV